MRLLTCAIVGMVCGCSTSTQIASSPLSGTVSGQAWTFQQGEVDRTAPSGDYVGTLFQDAYTACSTGKPPVPSVYMSIPRQPGTYAVGTSGTIGVEFVGGGFVDGVSLQATEGRLVVEAVTATSVTCALRASYDSDNEVEGQFELALCPTLAM